MRFAVTSLSSGKLDQDSVLALNQTAPMTLIVILPDRASGALSTLDVIVIAGLPPWLRRWRGRLANGDDRPPFGAWHGERDAWRLDGVVAQVDIPSPNGREKIKIGNGNRRQSGMHSLQRCAA
jgi:hypothetical protein